jgi:hypothetical protein
VLRRGSSAVSASDSIDRSRLCRGATGSAAEGRHPESAVADAHAGGDHPAALQCPGGQQDVVRYQHAAEHAWKQYVWHTEVLEDAVERRR